MHHSAVQIGFLTWPSFCSMEGEMSRYGTQILLKTPQSFCEASLKKHGAKVNNPCEPGAK